MELAFTINGSLDPVAAYAALLSTFIAIWELFKWWIRNAVILRCHPNMQIFPSVDQKKYVLADFTNKGQIQTVITNLCLYYWDKWHHRFFKKKWKHFWVKPVGNAIPFTVQPGEIWKHKIIQNEEIEKMARDGYLYVVVFHSMSNNPVMQRVHLPSTIKNPD